MTALISRCDRCNQTAPVIEAREFLTRDLVRIFAPHADCKGGTEAGEVLADTPANREALEVKRAGEKICPECLKRPVARKGLCSSCADLRERPRFNYRRPARRRRIGGRR